MQANYPVLQNFSGNIILCAAGELSVSAEQILHPQQTIATSVNVGQPKHLQKSVRKSPWRKL